MGQKTKEGEPISSGVTKIAKPSFSVHIALHFSRPPFSLRRSQFITIRGYETRSRKNHENKRQVSPCLVRTVEEDTEYRLGGARIRDDLPEKIRARDENSIGFGFGLPLF